MERQQTDPEVLRLIIELQNALDQGLIDLTIELTRKLQAKGVNITAPDTQEFLAEAFVALTAYFVFMATTMREAQVQIALSQVTKSQQEYVPLLQRAGAPASYIQRYATQQLAYPDRVRRAFYTKPHPADGVSFQHRIVTVRNSAQRTVRNIVRNSVRRGESTTQMARRIQGYLIPGIAGVRPTRPLTEARIATGATGKPTGVRSGSIPYQAHRIARSESAETLRASHSDMYENTLFAGGDYDWVLSNSHTGYDVCDDLARQSPYKADGRPHSHPNCLCDWRKRPPTLAEVREILRREGVL